MAEATTLQKFEAEAQRWVSENKTAKALWAKITDKTATALDCKSYADSLADEYSRLISKYYGTEIDMNVVGDDIRQILTTLQRRSSYYAQQFVKNYNEAESINIAAQEAVDSSRVTNLVNRLQDDSILNDGMVDEADQFLLKRNVTENIAENSVTETMKANAEIQEEAGFEVRVIRHLGADGCCDYCKGLAGTYTVAQAKALGVWAVHKDCDCWIEYKTDRIHKKITYTGRQKITSGM